MVERQLPKLHTRVRFPSPAFPVNASRDYSYDASGNLLSVSEPAKSGKADVSYTYDGLRRQITETSGGLTHVYAYDLAGNRLSTLYGGLSVPLVSTYDEQNRLSTLTQGALVTTYAYDHNGNVLTKTLPNGDVSASIYDALNRTTSLAGTSGASLALYSYGYAYDALGNVRQVSETYSNSSLNRVVTNTYDDANRLTQEAVTGSGAGTTAFSYDAAHNRQTMTKGGVTTNYSYNSRNQLTSFSDGLQTVSYTYDDNGNRTGRTKGTTTDSYQWDIENRLVGYNGPEVPPSGGEEGPLPVTKEFIGEIPTGGKALGHGTIYHVTDGPYPGLATYYEGDPNPRYRADYYWVSSSGTDVRGLVETSKSPAILMEKRLARLSGGGAQDEGWLYYRNFPTNAVLTADWAFYNQDFDPYEELHAITTWASTSGRLFMYDYRTRRVELQVDGNVTKVVFSGGTSVREFEDGVATVDYVRGSDWGGGVGGILYTARAGVPSFTHYNRRGDVTAKTDGTGTVTYQATYEAFGNRATEVGSTPDRLKSNTKDEDIPGYANEGFRFRDLETGAFLSKDPAGFVDGPNLYAYVVQNPWTKFDPEGLESLKDARKDGKVTIAESQDLQFTDKEATAVLKQYNAPVVTPKDVSDKTPQGFMQDINPVSKINDLRREFPGMSDSEVFAASSAKSNAARARYELVKNEGSQRDAQNIQLSMAMISLTTEMAMIPFSGIRAPAELLQGASSSTLRTPLNPMGPMKGPVTIKPPPNVSLAEIAEVQAYVQGANEAWRVGALSQVGRVPTAGSLRAAASQAAAAERAAGSYTGVVGHVPDTTWTGQAVGFSWLDQTSRVNSSIGGQAAAYPVGFQPTGFTLGQ